MRVRTGHPQRPPADEKRHLARIFLLNYARNVKKMHKFKLECLKSILRDNNIVVYQTYYMRNILAFYLLSCGNNQEESK